MKKTILFILILISCQNAFTQSKFHEGFNNGYKKGYCLDQIGCVVPVPPVPPVGIGESIDSYSDGYNRGFKMGLEDQTKSNRTNSSKTRESTKKSSPELVDDFMYDPYKNPKNVELTLKAAELKEIRKKELWESGVNSYNIKDYRNAVYCAHELLKIENARSEPYVLLAKTLFALSDYIGAYDNICKAEKINSSMREEINALKTIIFEDLRLMLGMDKIQNVIDFCETIQYPSNYTNYMLGFSYYRLRKYNQAKQAFKKVKNYTPAVEFIKLIDEGKYIDALGEKYAFPDYSF